MVEIITSCQSPGELADKVSARFQARGYRLEEGTNMDGVYANGSAAARVLVGGFAKRNKFSVKIMQQQDGKCTVILDKAMSGAMGGMIGVSKMNKEYNEVQQMLGGL